MPLFSQCWQQKSTIRGLHLRMNFATQLREEKVDCALSMATTPLRTARAGCLGCEFLDRASERARAPASGTTGSSTCLPSLTPIEPSLKGRKGKEAEDELELCSGATISLTDRVGGPDLLTRSTCTCFPDI